MPLISAQENLIIFLEMEDLVSFREALNKKHQQFFSFYTDFHFVTLQAVF